MCNYNILPLSFIFGEKLFLDGVFIIFMDIPFWNSSQMRNEPVLLFEQDDHLEGSLLFTPIDDVQISFWKDTHFVSWNFPNKIRIEKHENRVKLLIYDKTLPFLNVKELVRPLGSPHSYPSTQDKLAGLLFGEDGYYHKLQIRVSYLHHDTWDGYIPQKKTSLLHRTLQLLQEKKPLDIFLFGDSISAGANCSLLAKLHPYQPPFGELFQKDLTERYSHSQIRLLNLSVGGQSSEYGKKKISQILKTQQFNFDLVILGWGANDSSGRRNARIFRKNLEAQIRLIRKKNPLAEFIIINSSLKNELWSACWNSYLFAYQKELAKNVPKWGSFITILDLTALWNDMLTRKNYYDLTGNGLNHPNDFGHMIYAQALSSLL